MSYLVTRNANQVMDGFDSLFNDFFGDWNKSARIPSVDVVENEKEYKVMAELAGYTPEEVKIDVQKHVLTVSSEKKSQMPAKGEKYIVREMAFKAFERSFTLPEGINEEAISAEFKNGLLTIVLPKMPVQQPKRIEVKIN